MASAGIVIIEDMDDYKTLYCCQALFLSFRHTPHQGICQVLFRREFGVHPLCTILVEYGQMSTLVPLRLLSASLSI